MRSGIQWRSAEQRSFRGKVRSQDLRAIQVDWPGRSSRRTPIDEDEYTHTPRQITVSRHLRQAEHRDVFPSGMPRCRRRLG